jgi:hypothetical protein
MAFATEELSISWRDDILSIQGERLPVERIDINYLEAFCRPGSHDRDWSETVIPHQTRLLSADAGGSLLHLESRLADGAIVSHLIRSAGDEIQFRVEAHNPTDHESEVHWAQPCIRVGAFTGLDQAVDREAYLRRCFIFVAGEMVRMPTPEWETVARYTPGQVWCPRNVPRTDVNPRPLNPQVPSNGLIGCFSQDESMILATAWQPYQELFQGIIQCIHADFRIGGLRPGETKQIRGQIYLVENDVTALLERYAGDFPEHLTDDGCAV